MNNTRRQYRVVQDCYGKHRLVSEKLRLTFLRFPQRTFQRSFCARRATLIRVAEVFPSRQCSRKLPTQLHLRSVLDTTDNMIKPTLVFVSSRRFRFPLPLQISPRDVQLSGYLEHVSHASEGNIKPSDLVTESKLLVHRHDTIN